MNQEDLFEFKKAIEKSPEYLEITNIRYEKPYLCFNISTSGKTCFFYFNIFNSIISILKNNNLDSLFNFNTSLFTIVNETTIEVSLATSKHNEIYDKLLYRN